MVLSPILNVLSYGFEMRSASRIYNMSPHPRELVARQSFGTKPTNVPPTTFCFLSRSSSASGQI